MKFLSTLVLLASFIAPAIAAPPAAVDEKMPQVTEQYLKIQEALANDSLDGVGAAAEKITTLSMSKDVLTPAKALTKAKTIEKARASFKDLSVPVVRWVKLKKPEGLKVASCSMAKAAWVQKGSEIRNPYYGASMLTCGEWE